MQPKNTSTADVEKDSNKKVRVIGPFPQLDLPAHKVNVIEFGPSGTGCSGGGAKSDGDKLVKAFKHE